MERTLALPRTTPVWHSARIEGGPAEGDASADRRASSHQRTDLPTARINPIDLQKHLKGMNYPASKQAVIDKAKENGADEEVQSALESLNDQEFETPADVNEAIDDLND